MSEPSSATIAVVIPAYRQPQFLGAAIRSALEQRCSVPVGVVVVNDGCPYESTERIALELRAGDPERMAYLRQPNRGLSAARNAGIRHALQTWPTIEAVFPLDADNRLSPQTLELLWRALGAADGAAWASPRFEFIGDRVGGWQIPGPWSTYRELFDNQSDAGSLIAREVFDRGIFYDEEMRDGYEDWELYVRAMRAGFRGVPAGSCGFRYRTRPHSMVARAKARHEHAYGQVVERHAELFAPRRLTAREHEEVPRFALVHLDTEVVELTAAFDLEPRRSSLANLAGELVTSRGGLFASDEPLAPMTLLANGGTFAWLEHERLLAGVAYRLQGELRGRECVGLRLVAPPRAGRVETVAAESTAPVHALAVRSSDLYQRLLAEGPEEPRALEPEAVVEVALPGAESPPAALAPGISLRRYRGDAVEAPLREVEGETHTTFFARRHIDMLETTFPWTGSPAESRRMAFLLLPRGDSGGMQRAALNVLEAMRELDPGLSAHLVLTDGPEIDAATAALGRQFDSVTSLGGTARKLARALLARMLTSADIVVNAHSRLGYELLPELDEDCAQVSLLQTFEFDSLGVPTGYPLVAAREYEPLIDVFCVPSRRLARQLENLYVTPAKIVVGRNAPIVRPASIEAALELARRKARRRATSDSPLRLLFAGRLDRQKGIERLAAIAGTLERGGHAVELTVVGEAVLDPETAELPGSVRFAGTAQDPAALEAHYERADVFLLPSRWEGAPLALLDAMAFGCLVVATDVGAVPELVDDGLTGVLVDHRLDEQEIVERFVAAVADVLADPEGARSLRERACEQAMALSWLDAARPLLGALEPAARAEAGA